jgi:5-methyltetrahydropteroyltriglutamate--homocysteine methyltransferase
MSIPTEPIGSIPRPASLIAGLARLNSEAIGVPELESLQAEAIADTIRRFEATGSPVITDGEQSKPSFVTYPINGSGGVKTGGVIIDFADGHSRQLPILTSGPFRYQTYADRYLRYAKDRTVRAVKQAVIAPSALSLLYPRDGLPGYFRQQFLEDLANESETDIRRCLEAGADSVQLDFTDARLALKLDPSKTLLHDFIELNNNVLQRFNDDERSRIGIHTCPGGDHDSTHSLDVDYAELLPDLFRLAAGRFYLQLASERDRRRVLEVIRANSHEKQRIFVGVIDAIAPRMESANEVCERVLEAAEYIPLDRLGTCDDCGFSPFADDTSTSRDTAFEKIAARVAGTQLAAEKLGV